MKSEITNNRFMTIREVSEIFGKDVSTITKIGKELFPDLFRNGVTTYLDESQVTLIKLHLGKNSELPKTDLEKKLLIRQAVALLEDEIFELRLENEKANSQIKMLVHDFNKTYTTTEIAKELNLKSAQQLNNILQDKKVQYRQNGTWVLFSNYSDKGYTSIKETVLDSGKIVYDRLWTGSGRQFLLSIIQESK